MSDTSNTEIIPNGIPNRGNTCYFNAAVQTLCCIVEDIFISGEYCKKLPDNENIKNFMFHLAHLIASIENNNGKWNKKHINIHLNYVFSYIGTLDNFKRFIRYSQADSAEFLIELIDILSTYMRYEISFKITLSVKEKHLDEMDKKRLCFYNTLKQQIKYTSIIEDRIQGYYRASIKCNYEDCDNVSEKFEPFLTLQLPIDGMNTLEECISDYVKPIQLDPDNQWLCDKCKRKSQAIRKLSLWKTGNYIIILLKRYLNIQISTVKDGRSIVSPEYLDLSQYIEDNRDNENLYSLCSITFHSGNLNKGHYVNVRKTNNKWFVFNDESVQNANNINTSSGYYLVYKRKI